jgi:hypothetical protein
MSWLTVKMGQARRQREVVAQITKYDFCELDYGFQVDKAGKYDPNAKSYVPDLLIDLFGIDFFENVVNVKVYQDVDSDHHIDVEQLTELPKLRKVELGYVVSDNDFRQLANLKNLQELFIHSDQFTNAGIVHLKSLPRLEKLTLIGDNVTDESLSTIKELERLRYLEICFGRFTGTGLAHLKNLKNLRTLYLHDLPCKQKIIEKEFENLADLPQLKIFGIDEEQLTDASLTHLKGLKNIEKIEIWSSHVTREGMDELLKSMPNATSNFTDNPGPGIPGGTALHGGIGVM